MGAAFPVFPLDFVLSCVAMMTHNKTILVLKVMVLVAVLAGTSGFRFRCYWFCTDQTSVQSDYVADRDRCRKFAELKLDMAMRDSVSDRLFEIQKDRKGKLVELFSECMARTGWTVPDGKEGHADVAVVPPIVVTPTAPATDPQMEKYRLKASISRSSECNFARYAASTSSIAAARAKACNLECAQRLKAAPDAPRPAACPSEFNPSLAYGQEWEGGGDDDE